MQYWCSYYHNASAVIWVVDSNDKSDLEKSKDAFHKFIKDMLEQNKNSTFFPIVAIFVHKQDLENCLKKKDIYEAFEIEKYKKIIKDELDKRKKDKNIEVEINMEIFETSYLKNPSGIFGAMEWVYELMLKQNKNV